MLYNKNNKRCINKCGVYFSLLRNNFFVINSKGYSGRIKGVLNNGHKVIVSQNSSYHNKNECVNVNNFNLLKEIKHTIKHRYLSFGEKDIIKYKNYDDHLSKLKLQVNQIIESKMYTDREKSYFINQILDGEHNHSLMLMKMYNKYPDNEFIRDVIDINCSNYLKSRDFLNSSMEHKKGMIGVVNKHYVESGGEGEVKELFKTKHGHEIQKDTLLEYQANAVVGHVVLKKTDKYHTFSSGDSYLIPVNHVNTMFKNEKECLKIYKQEHPNQFNNCGLVLSNTSISDKNVPGKRGDYINSSGVFIPPECVTDTIDINDLGTEETDFLSNTSKINGNISKNIIAAVNLKEKAEKHDLNFDHFLKKENNMSTGEKSFFDIISDLFKSY